MVRAVRFDGHVFQRLARRVASFRNDLPGEFVGDR
jgi:hypothetical protein